MNVEQFAKRSQEAFLSALKWFMETRAGRVLLGAAAISAVGCANPVHSEERVLGTSANPVQDADQVLEWAQSSDKNWGWAAEGETPIPIDILTQIASFMPNNWSMRLTTNTMYDSTKNEQLLFIPIVANAGEDYVSESIVTFIVARVQDGNAVAAIVCVPKSLICYVAGYRNITGVTGAARIERNASETRQQQDPPILGFDKSIVQIPLEKIPEKYRNRISIWFSEANN